MNKGSVTAVLGKGAWAPDKSFFPVRGLVIGPSLALFCRAQYNKAIKGNVYSRDFPEAVLVTDVSCMLSPELTTPKTPKEIN